jgi:aryl-alcohol dehydrogenase-like predicted oxidoreductase
MEIENIGAIGFGAYRVSINNESHHQALAYALAQGCSLIDTSSNYTNGESEELIGKVLSENPNFDPFLVTKAGYIQNDNFENLRYLHSINKAKDDLVTVHENLSHSIHPEFLANQIAISQARLRRKVIDGFLLHNPEYHSPLSSRELQESYYKKIQKAFEFLEEQVSIGTIRYYGVSSNTLSLSESKADSTNLAKLVDIAGQVNSANHFKIVQFPLNLVENEVLQSYPGVGNLVDFAKRNGVITLSNRPLNARLPSGTLRLATYQDLTDQLNQPTDTLVLTKAIELVSQRLKMHALPDDPMIYPIIKTLSEKWHSIANTEAVDQLFENHFYPFIMELYQDQPPEADQEVFIKLYSIVSAYARRNMTVKALEFRKHWEDEGILDKNTHESLPLQACRYYLAKGIDCVLVGMKNKKYVDELKQLF